MTLWAIGESGGAQVAESQLLAGCPNEDYGRIDAHEVNTDFSADFSTGGWDEE